MSGRKRNKEGIPAVSEEHGFFNGSPQSPNKFPLSFGIKPLNLLKERSSFSKEVKELTNPYAED